MIASAAFWILAAAVVVSALGVILARSAVASAMSLLVTMAALAGLYLVLAAPLLALFQLIVYIGAVLVLFIFVLMLLNIRGQEEGAGIIRRRASAAAAAAIGLPVAIFAWLFVEAFSAAGPSMGIDTLQARVPLKTLALDLFSRHAFVFELASVLLLVAAVGAIYISRKEDRP